MIGKIGLISISLATLLTTGAFAASGAFTMSDADKKMYEELKENNPAEMDIEYGSEIFEDAVGGEAALAEFFGVKPENLTKYIAGFPRYIEKLEMVVGLDQALQAAMHVNGKKPYKLTGKEMVSLSAYVKSLANDMKNQVDIRADKHIAEAYKLGEQMWYTKRGIRGFSCSDCHDSLESGKGVAGMILRTQQLPMVSDISANSMGTWPAYRMKNSQLTTLQKRFKQCMNNSMQAKIPEGSKEMVALEVYVANMNKNMPIQIPGLKR
jgi:sulfur-oxidizing protein SoxA